MQARGRGVSRKPSGCEVLRGDDIAADFWVWLETAAAAKPCVAWVQEVAAMARRILPLRHKSFCEGFIAVGFDEAALRGELAALAVLHEERLSAVDL